MNTEFDIEEVIKVEDSASNEGIHDLMVYNDDFNTFDHVIGTLIKVCKHDLCQAEQCTYLIHYNGKCSVKKDFYEALKPKRDSILSTGIKAAIV